MFGNHVSNLSSAYCHNELTPAESRRFEDHLAECERCRLDFEDVKVGQQLASQLTLASAPAALWNDISTALDGTRARRRPAFLIPATIAACVIALVFAGWLLRRKATPALPTESQTGWNVARLGGAPRINSRTISDKARLGIGQWLETDANSRAKVDVSNIGNVEIDPNTRVRLIETKPTEHRLELERGRLSARISAPPKLFFVNTPSGVAEDLGCIYTLEVDDHGNSLLRVTFGWVSLQLLDRESMVPTGAACATRPGIGPGTPYFEDASEAFRSGLSAFDFPNTADANARKLALAAVIREARPRDAMTLFYLLPRVEGAERGQVYDRMATLVTPPDRVTREGVLKLNPEMVERWRARLSLTIRPSKFAPLKAWKKMWTAGLGKLNGLEGKK